MVVEEMAAAYTTAVRKKDAEAFAALYADDTRNFDMWGNFSLEGAGAVRRMADGWFASVGTDRIVVEFQDGRIGELTFFLDTERLFPLFGLPLTLDP